MLIYVTPAYLNAPACSGIKKKVLSQVRVLQNHFGKVYYTMCCEGMIYLMDGDRIIDKELSVTRQMMNEVFCAWLDKYQVDKTYIRYEYSSNLWFLRFLAQQKERNVRSVLEIPTYPYDQELANGRLKLEDGLFRREIPRYVDCISTYSKDKTIWGIPCINLINGVDLESNPLRKRKKENRIVLIGVSSFSPWHGYERVIMGLHNYYKDGGEYDILFKLVGTGPQEKYYRSLTAQYNLQNHVEFCGNLSGEELDRQYIMADIAIGSLAIYRIGLQAVCTIKSAEYCARGIPMIIGHDDIRFPSNAEYVVQIPNSPEPLNMQDVIGFYNKTVSQEDLSLKMRQFAEEHFMWDRIMIPVVEYLNQE